MKPSILEIATEIKTLRRIKPKVIRYNAFGEDNHAQIEAQIEILEKFAAYNEALLMAATDAIKWLEGDLDKSLSEGWKAIME